MAIIDFPYIFVPDPAKGRPLFSGQIFVGVPDLDPEIPANQVQLNVVQEDGTVIPVAQPFIIGPGGVPTYNGATVRLDVDGNYSFKVLDKNDAQTYYVANVFEIEPVDQPISDIEAAAIAINVLDSDITYDEPGEIVASYIYSPPQQKTYSVPASAIGETIVSVVGNILTTTGLVEHILLIASTKNTSVNILDFGADPTGLADSSAAIQDAIKYCYDNDLSLKGANGDFLMSSTVYIPQYVTSGSLDLIKTLDFMDARFYVPTGGTLFESGELVGSNWVSYQEHVEGGVNSFNVDIKNFGINGGDFGVRLNNYHQGCIVHNITTNDCRTAVDLKHCFYTRIDAVRTFSSQARPWTDDRFTIRGTSNLMTFTNLVAVNSNVGYKFDNPAGGFASINFEQNSIEGCNIGLEFTGLVNNVGIKDNYFEVIIDVCMKFDDDVRSGVVENNYFNLLSEPGVYIFEHSNSTATRIAFDASNQSFLSNGVSDYFKNSETSWGSFVIDEGNDVLNSLADLARVPGNYPKNTAFRGTRNFGFDEALANVNRGLIPSNFSGRTTIGYDLGGKLYGCVEEVNAGTSMEYSTIINHQERQLLYISLRIDDGTRKEYKGLVIGDVFWEFGVALLEPSLDVVMSEDVNGFTKFVVNNLTAATQTYGAEVRVI